MTDPYKILGVGRTATQDEIKTAYRKLAAQHHPDRGGDTKKFQEVQGAYEILSDSEKRAEHDNPRQQMGGFHFHSRGFPPGMEEIFGDMFGGIFGQRMQKNRTLNIQTAITLEEAFFGKNIIANLRLPSGKEHILDVKVPPGINDGQTLRFAEMGDDSISNLPKGDINLTINVQPHSRFERHGDDLVEKLNLNCLDAIVGKIIKITTIDGKELEIQINPGTQHGQLLSIHGHGMPNIRDPRMRGRLLLNVNIVVPTDLSDKDKEKIQSILC